MKMIDECKIFKPNYLNKFSDRILVLSSKHDAILNTKYNDDFCNTNDITNIYLDTSHSLFEDINTAFAYTINFFEEKN